MSDHPVAAPEPLHHAPPQQLSRFVGRVRELDELERLLASSRLVTLTGAGGSGKTRLAAEVATRLARSSGKPVAWVDLAALSDPEQLARYVAASLGIGEQADRTHTQTLVDQLCPHAVLLVLDNCEHLVDACASLARSLLLGCPRMRVLATSREALGVAGETAWLVPPLGLPPAAHASMASVHESEAGQLFVARARDANAAFELTEGNAADVAAICRRLDGIPLAIELAAARARLLAPAQIAQRLDDVFRLLAGGRGALPRHRTLREAIDWSHALLDDDERLLFRRLGVFARGFTLEAAEAVCADGSCRTEDVFEVLSALVDKSMVQAEPHADDARFALLEPMRQYALEKLEESGEDAVLRERHARFFADFADAAEPSIRGGTREDPWMRRLERDHANLRGARDWAAANDVVLALRLEAALLWFHFAFGLFDEPRRRIEQLLARGGGAAPALRGRALTAIGYYAIWQGDYAAVGPAFSESLAVLRESGDREALAAALIGLASGVGLAGDRAAADAMFDQAEAALGGRDGASRGGYPTVFLYAFGNYWRGVVAQHHGDVEAARAGFEAAIAAARRFGDHPTIAHPLAALVRLLALQGELDAALTALAESLPIHARNDDRWGLVQALDGAAFLAAGRGESTRAARILGAADGIRERVGVALPPHEVGVREQIAAALRAALGAEAFEESLRAGRMLSVDQVVAEAIGPAGRPQAAPAASTQVILGEAGRVPRLRVHALGPLRIELDGVELERDAFGPAKPRELLLYLLTREGGATREQVGLALWPELSAARVGNNFHVTLHRLRKALGEPDAIELRDERYRFADSFPVWLDAAAFGEGAGAALRGEADAGRLSAALSLYRGPFLDDEVVGDWAEDVRERLHRLFVEASLALGLALLEAGRWSDAAETYRRLIALEELQESAYRGLMTALAQGGDRTGALRLYQQLVTLLRDELGADPEEATRDVYEKLLQPAILPRT